MPEQVLPAQVLLAAQVLANLQRQAEIQKVLVWRQKERASVVAKVLHWEEAAGRDW